MNYRRVIKTVSAVLGIGAFMLGGGAALGQDYPNRPIRFIVPWSTGGGGDVAVRILTQALSIRLGQPILVENRPGANGQIGANLTAKSAPDGYTLMQDGGETHAINPHVYKNLQYDPTRDFVGIAPFVIIPFALAARPDLPANSVKELVALVKQSQGKSTYASWGIGSTSQIGMEMFKAQAGIEAVHVPYPRESPGIVALIAGQVDVMVMTAGAASRQAGKVKVLAVTVPERFSNLPNVPTLREEGYAVDAYNWLGVVAPAKTPAPIIQRLAAEIQIVLQSPEIKEKYRAMGFETHAPMSQPDFNRFMASEIVRWGEVIKRANIRLD